MVFKAPCVFLSSYSVDGKYNGVIEGLGVFWFIP